MEHDAVDATEAVHQAIMVTYTPAVLYAEVATTAVMLILAATAKCCVMTFVYLLEIEKQKALPL